LVLVEAEELKVADSVWLALLVGMKLVVEMCLDYWVDFVDHIDL
jgi:hypothetical protein